MVPGTVGYGEDSEFWKQINLGLFLGFELPNYVTWDKLPDLSEPGFLQI